MGAVIALCALLGAVAGIAGSAAAPSKSKKSSKKSGNATQTAPRGLGLRHGGAPGGPGGPGVHSTSVVLNKAGDGFITVTADAGTIKSISGSDVTIDESVGTVHYKDVTVTIPAGATIIRNAAKATLSDLKAADSVRVIASSEQTIVIAEDAAFRAQARKRGPWGHGGPGRPGGPPGPPPGFNNAPPPNDPAPSSSGATS
jgi:GTPase involved in cell partitioning and DNA repair